MVFLSLALLLMAFFALLNAISSIEQSRSRRVVDSVVSAFSSPFGAPASKDATEPVADIAFAERPFSDLAAFFRRAVEVVEVAVVRPGRLLQVRLPARRIFARRTAQITVDSEALLARIAAALAAPPDGVRLDLEVFLEHASGAPATRKELRIARAGAVARALVDRGVAPDRVAVGLIDGRPSTLRLVFHRRAAGEAPRHAEPVPEG